MTAAKLIEYRITRQLLRSTPQSEAQQDLSIWADRLIAILAATAGLCILGSYLEGLLWLVVATATVHILGK